MDGLKGTKSEQNILAAFAGESQARNRYTFFAEQARSEGHEDVAQMFERMAKNEMTHAKMWFKLYHDGLGESGESIQEAAKGENSEWRSMYPEFAKQAREDGLEQLAVMFEKVAEIEKDHEKTFLQAYIALQEKKLAQKGQASQEPAAPKKARAVYRCMFCGAVFDNRPDVCSVCGAIGSFDTDTVVD